ncbi:MAG: T9SS type A sorting domain-containing protein [Bacteroidia bacterium]
MKKTFYFISLCAVTVCNAQPVINETDVFTPGSSCLYGFTSLPNITAGNPGASQTYSMTGLTPNFTVTQEVTTPANSPFGQAFPGNTVLVANQGTQGASYFTKNSTALMLTGMITPDFNNPNLFLEEPYTPALLVVDFPISYAQTNNGISYHEITFYVGIDLGDGWITDSIRRRVTDVYNYEIDGWGTLTTPTGTYSVLRQKTTTVSSDTSDHYRSDINAWVTAHEITQGLSVSYTFWAAGQSFPIAEMGDIDDDGIIESCGWAINIASSLPNSASSIPAFDVFPNPASGIVTLVSKADENTTWTLLDMNGRKVVSGSIVNEQETLDFQSITEGVYLLQLESPEGIASKRLVIRPQR